MKKHTAIHKRTWRETAARRERHAMFRCSACEQQSPNPCVLDLKFPVDGREECVTLPVLSTKVVRAKAKADLMTPQFFCATARELNRRKLSPQEVRGLVTYKIFEALYHDMRYEHDSGRKLEIGPDTIEDVFDGRPQLALSADEESWHDEIIASDRSITDWLTKAAAGEITNSPGESWHLKLMYIDLALRTPDLDPRDLD